jgi:hypothetical protein
LKSKFEKSQANGIWLAERVWKSSMAKIFMKYTVEKKGGGIN